MKNILLAALFSIATALGPCRALAQDATPRPQSQPKPAAAPDDIKGVPAGLTIHELYPNKEEPVQGVPAGLTEHDLPGGWSGEVKQPNAKGISPDWQNVLGPIKFATKANTQYNLGLYYENGQGVTQDYVRAAYWYRRAAEQGDAEAQDRLAHLYNYGLGVTQDYAQAAQWYRKAAEQGNADAQFGLGVLYSNGDGVTQDYAQAAIWYRKAAEQGDAEAQSSLVAVQELLAEAKEKQLERRNRILIAAIGVAFLTSVAFTLFRFRKKLINTSKKLISRTTRAKQLAILLPVASWCSACCLYQVLTPRLMHHPINAAVTAMLLSAPALIFGAVSLWWLSHPLAENGPVPTSARPEPANAPTESAPEHTELVARAHTRGYRWGKFQGWANLVYGVVLLIYAFLSSSGYSWSNPGRYAGDVYIIYLGYGLIKKYRYGLILFYLGIPLDLLVVAFVFHFGLLSFNFASLIGVALFLACSVIPAIFYYPKRWKEFSRRPSKAAPREAPQAIEIDPKEARAEAGFFQTPK